MTSADMERRMRDDDYPGGWFGQSWGAPVCEQERHRPTPAGASCMYCEKAIESDDQGLLIPGSRLRGGRIVYVVDATHLACFLEQIGTSGVIGKYCRTCHTFHATEEGCDS